MMQRRLPRLTPAMTVLAAIIVLLVLVDVVVATRLVATRSTSPAAGSSQQAASGHPCNHGYEVSRAAHAKKGKSTKDAGCSPKQSGSASDDPTGNRSGNDSDNDSDS